MVFGKRRIQVAVNSLAPNISAATKTIVGERWQFLSNVPDETKFEVDSLWAKPCLAYHVQHEPDPATIQQITELQDQIDSTGAPELHRVPAHSLHMAVLTLFPAVESKIMSFTGMAALRELARISHGFKRIGAPNQRKLFCENDFLVIRG